MPSPSDHATRASDAERERVVELLRVASTEGRLSVDELEERTADALAARTRAELAPLTRDLPGEPARSRPRRSATRPGRALGHEIAAYLAVNLILVLVWAATGADYFWPMWPMLGWGLGIAKHARQGDRRPHGPARGLHTGSGGSS
ncbi:MAG: hypothetical protein AVDCRST_MAG45-176 [uncultured Solirubrobacterales bacterium]|uniref:Uncharacterized protein n=1 Tax=uncultured Solirubrobacterales bacterium TaxID=768556 RepID=A0A6J4RTC9_9ACTN|nr:MAG: hypothetical protein AVDCRST_MAG45-176 [uncultured Solirubrobacterales bacterium]